VLIANPKSKIYQSDKGMAETTGFEPVVVFNDYNGLANRRFQPLSHVSAFVKTQT
jgi:hypothetical protein